MASVKAGGVAVIYGNSNVRGSLQFLQDSFVILQKQEILKLATKIKSVVHLENENHIKELGEMVSTDPRLIDELQYDLLTDLVLFLEYTQNLKIQSHATIILQTFIAYSSNMQWVISKLQLL